MKSYQLPTGNKNNVMVDIVHSGPHQIIVMCKQGLSKKTQYLKTHFSQEYMKDSANHLPSFFTCFLHSRTLVAVLQRADSRLSSLTLRTRLLQFETIHATLPPEYLPPE